MFYVAISTSAEWILLAFYINLEKWKVVRESSTQFLFEMFVSISCVQQSSLNWRNPQHRHSRGLALKGNLVSLLQFLTIDAVLASEAHNSWGRPCISSEIH